eukprot:SRR837773.575.p2 GENE.SRR837773.575~~SRR837773.575.p2  ORF type:complete len:150 (-),score=33.12 SRR837773.575:106-555(-)
MAEYVGGPQRWRYVKVGEAASGTPAVQRPKKDIARVQSDGRLDAFKRLGYDSLAAPRPKPQSLLSQLIRPEWRAYGTAVPEELKATAVKPVCSAPELPKTFVGNGVKIDTWQSCRVLKFNEGDRLVVKRWQPGYNVVPARSMSSLPGLP